LFYTALAGSLFCGGFLPFVAIMPSPAGCGMMLFLGVAGLASHFCLIRAFAAAPANVIAPFGYMSLVWAALFSLVIFAEAPRARNLRRCLDCRGRPVRRLERKKAAGLGAA
jgi:drug/metabolite transporter (DMT)-like permease